MHVRPSNTSGTEQDAGFLHEGKHVTIYDRGEDWMMEGRIEEHSTHCNCCAGLTVNAHGPAHPALDGTPRWDRLLGRNESV